MLDRLGEGDTILGVESVALLLVVIYCTVGPHMVGYRLIGKTVAVVAKL